MLLWLLTSLVFAAFAQEPSPFDFDRTMRVDYFHNGGPTAGETLALDRIVNDGPWPGSRTRLVDGTNLGKYLFEVHDASGGRLLYSRGFASVFGEWETTAESRKVHRTFHESLRFPWPRRPVRVTLLKRQDDQRFAAIWSTDVDPASRFVNPATLPARAPIWTVFESGPAAQKVDLLIISEGYTPEQMGKFRQDATRLLDALFAEEPFRSRRSDFNVRALELPSSTAGVNRPNAGVFRRTPVSAEYNIFDSERYILTLDNRALRDAAAAAPYEFIEILVNDATYGGGGIFNDHATAAVDSAFAAYVFVHEFGHHFAALADEYYTSDVAYETGNIAKKPEPWEPNVTALLDPAVLKWRDLVTPGTPLPTPWPKDAFERHSRAIQARRRAIRERQAPEHEMDALFREQRAFEQELLSGSPYAGAVGAFEGASYEVQGLYRPQVDCIMFTRNPVGFCRVCQRAIGTIIDLYSK
ncbi:MAG TPA: M64 family metallopeptidase [Vicinamibacterales bacterium]|nr:M64 family metallopeptidase [Vicinamibacterales bacterium]